MTFTLPDLPYAHDALASAGMSEETLKLHHDLHHKAYVDNANKLIVGTGLEDKTLEEVVRASHGDARLKGLFNNAAQHWNHVQFWSWMKPAGGGEPPAALAAALTKAFGSVDGFKAEFVKVGLAQFGSGWVWLVSENGALKVVSTPNGENPLHAAGQTALLGSDVWEHSYYVDFRNKRQGYLENFLNKLVNWDDVAARLAAI